MEILVENLDDTKKLAEIFGELIKEKGAFVSLFGDIGAGKTAFSRFLIKYLGVIEEVTSPSFVILNEYKSKFFDKMLSLTDYENKIIVMKNVDRISIHPNHNKKQLLMPEDKVNGINIVKESEVDNLLKYYNDFHEKKEYIID